ncbi:MAG: radical SAM protein [Candidatus Thermoplasmatota archaeon]
MTNARFILKRYYDILENDTPAYFLQTKNIPVCFSKSESTKSLWKKHERAFTQRPTTFSHQQTLLDLKIELASRIFMKCIFCEHRCLVDRTKTTGFCGVKQTAIASEFLHYGEEPDLIPSYTIFFSGCTFRCVFCQNYDISQQICGTILEPQKLAERISLRYHQNAKNVNWVGGEPTSHLPYILSVLKYTTTNIPMIWNSNMYCSRETMKLLQGIVDVYLTDFKYGNNRCAERLSQSTTYLRMVKRNHRIAYHQGEVIVRHLILPSHVQCCSKQILRWIAKNIPQCMVNIMDQYRPCYQASNYPDIARPISSKEYTHVTLLAEQLGLHCY